MRWENIIRDRLDSYESPLPVNGFEALLSDSLVPQNASVRVGRPIVYQWIPSVLVACVMVFFYNWPAVSDEEPLIAEPVRLADNTVEVLIIPGTEPETIGYLVEREDIHNDSPTLAVKDPASVQFESETEESRAISDTTQSLDSLRNSGGQDCSQESLRSEGPSQPIDNRRFEGYKALRLGTSGLVATAFVVGRITGSGVHGSESLPSEATTSFNHNQPLKLALSVGIPLAQGWRITAGVSYSRYHSEEVSPSFSSSRIQRVHFLGIPVRLDDVIVKARWFDVYAGVGVEPEICVAATLSGNDIYHDRFLFSFQSAAGAQMFLTDQVSVYIEPALYWVPFSSYFSPKTYHTQTSFSFALSFGLRFNMRERNSNRNNN